MTELQAALGLCVLEGLAGELAARRRLLARYSRRFAEIDGITWVQGLDSPDASGQYAVIRVDASVFGCSRDALHAELRRYNVFTRKYFFPLCADYDCYRRVPSAAPGALPVARRAVQEVLCVPLYGALTEADVDRIADMVVAIRSAAGRSVAAGAAE